MKKYRIFQPLLAFAGLVIAGLTAAQDLTLHCGHVIDPAAATVLDNRHITIKDGRFAEIRPWSASDSVDLDLSDAWCLPGLIDMHTHLSGQFSKDAYREKFTKNPADVAFDAALHAGRTLDAGFTTVRDLGDSFNVTIALRKAIAQGKVRGPRIFTAAKSLASTGGHADPSNGYREGLWPHVGPHEGVLDGPDEARKAVRQRYKDGADLIKITATGGVLSEAASGDNAQFQDDELRAIIETARDYGFKVAAHAHGKEGMKRAIIAGVNSIEHGTYLDDEIARLMKKHGTYLVPTLLAGAWVTEKSKIPGFFPPVVARKAATIGPVIASAFARAHEKGVKIAFGTDSGVSAHGDNAREFALMVENGMTPMQAIAAATVNAADLLGQTDQLGAIKPGYYADLVAVKRNPLDDIRALEQIDVVIKNGKQEK